MGFQVEELTQGRQPWEKEFIDFSFDGKHTKLLVFLKIESFNQVQYCIGLFYNDVCKNIIIQYIILIKLYRCQLRSNWQAILYVITVAEQLASDFPGRLPLWELFSLARGATLTPFSPICCPSGGCFHGLEGQP